MDLKKPHNFLDFLEDVKKDKSKKISFDDFCVNAGYYKPLAVQSGEWRDFFNKTETRIFLGHRFCGKTDYLTICSVAYEVYLDPDKTFLIVVKTDDRCGALSLAIQNVFIANGVEMSEKKASSIRLTTGKGSNQKDPHIAFLPSGTASFRGRHPNMILFDDIITPKDTSEAERRKVETVYSECLKLVDNLMIIGQPVHPHDLHQKVRDKILTKVVINGDVPELEVDLEKQRKAQVSEKDIRANYFLELLLDDYLPFSKITESNDFDFKRDDYFMFIDPSSKGKDYTAISIGYVHFDRLKVIGWAFQQAWYELEPFFSQIFKILKIYKCYGETNGIGDSMPREAKKDWGLNITGYYTSENKKIKILNFAKYSEFVDLVKVNDFYSTENKQYIDFVKNWEYNNTQDDAPDSLASLGIVMKLINYKKGNK